ncbi:MAG: hypothetical protein M3282_04660 [Gemmatimonadota bacterium]|nr:hypothetical protein [Gemmatimonadota bacterium]
MITRHASLSQALDELEAGTLNGVSTIIVSRDWWNRLSRQERSTYRVRARRAEVELRADSKISTHFVEAHGSDTGPLSSERPT